MLFWDQRHGLQAEVPSTLRRWSSHNVPFDGQISLSFDMDFLL
ncbi:hypothetical protein AZE42_09718 [Rhizopogon vesiculosus]|uniref:Uncharacterized protein n=1 Tax=Rhizopogon vesiculosus TaxID=180088 RepID=A0A1J8QML2_9AGAM|nr:hypothetical protein AZE42_09718 [Rhizopogon vesiculosus]